MCSIMDFIYIVRHTVATLDIVDGKVEAAVLNNMLDGFFEHDWKENSSLL